jgi:hypothetical protein
MADKNEKKQLLLRLSPSLWNEISRWADDEFRSINGQIEFILSEAVRKHRKAAGEAENQTE